LAEFSNPTNEIMFVPSFEIEIPRHCGQLGC